MVNMTWSPPGVELSREAICKENQAVKAKKRRNHSGLSRRTFLKAAAVSAGAFALPSVFTPRRLEAFEPGQSVHPNISPLRVVGIEDANMTTEPRTRINWNDQEQLVRADVIATNMDRLACALAEEKKVRDAWQKIFIKPPDKAWSDVVVAIKTNHIAQQHTRSPVMAKLCHALTDELGVRGSNVHIYDATNGGNLAQSTPFKGLPEGVRIENTWGGHNTPVPVPGPWRDGKGTANCVGPLARGEVDILVNIALCKGHNAPFGAFTMCLKNHFGTFAPGCNLADATDYLLCINKSEAILGKTDAASGRVLFPRQQLCLIDALWASQPGPGGHPETQPNRLFMGTFGPTLDYVVATAYRRDTMKWQIQEQVTARFLTEYGFSPDDLLPERFVDAMRYTA